MSRKQKSLKHDVHMYEKIAWGSKGTNIWRCAIVGCNHYLHVEFILGKRSLCWKCNKPFTMTYTKLLRNRPKCDDCQASSGQGPARKPVVKKVVAKLVPKQGEKGKEPDLSDINIDDLLENL